MINNNFSVLRNSLETEAISCGIKDPGIVVGALHAGVKAVGGAGQLTGAQRAGVGQGAVGLPLDHTLLLPILEVPQTLDARGVLNPLENLHIIRSYKVRSLC